MACKVKQQTNQKEKAQHTQKAQPRASDDEHGPV